MDDEIIIIIDEVEFYDEKKHRVGYDNPTGAFITTYNNEKRKVKVTTSGREDP